MASNLPLPVIVKLPFPRTEIKDQLSSLQIFFSLDKVCPAKSNVRVLVTTNVSSTLMSFVKVMVSPSLAPSKAAFSVAYVVSPICATGSDPSAIAVGTSVNIIVSDNNIARIRRFISLPPKVFFIFCPSPRAGFTWFAWFFRRRRDSRTAARPRGNRWWLSRHGRKSTVTTLFCGCRLSHHPA